jgi:hypothetical protein
MAIFSSAHSHTALLFLQAGGRKVKIVGNSLLGTMKHKPKVLKTGK